MSYADVFQVVGLVGVGVLLAGIAWSSRCPVLHVFAYSAAWGLTMASGHVLLDGALRPQGNTVAVIYGSWWAFLIGAGLPFWLGLNGRRCVRKALNGSRTRAAIAALVCLHVIAIMWEWGALNISLSMLFGSPLTVLARLRLSRSFGAVNLPWFIEVWRWSFVYYVPLATAAFRARILGKASLSVIIVAGLILASLRFTRAPVIEVLVVFGTAWLLTKHTTVRRLLVVGSFGGVVTMLVFLGMQQVITRTETTAHGLELQERAAAYFGGPVKAYDLLLNDKYERDPGWYSFEQTVKLIHYFGVDVSDPGIVRKYIRSPIQTNVYTYLDAYTLDAGVCGAVVGAFLTGLACSLVLAQFINTLSIAWLIVYSVLTYASLLSFLNNEFIRFSIVLIAAMALGIERAVRGRTMSRDVGRGISTCARV